MTYRLFGAETSAYSTKMRAYLKYKAVAFDWVPRTQDTEAELKSLSRFPTLPVLVTGSGFAVHDTTPMMEALEADSPEPSATPADAATAFLACVLEEYADVWLAKAAYHYRWTRKKDQRIAAARAIDDYYTREAPEDRKAAEDAAIETMLGQMKAMGLEGEIGGAIEKSFKRFVKLLDDHLRKHLFIFGGRPSIADFAIAGQLLQMMKDPTPAKIIEKDGEFVARWCEFLQDPQPSGPFEALDDLKETLAPVFAEELACAFLPWAAENLENSLAGHETFEVTLGKEAFQLAPLRSAARSFRELRRKFVTGQTIEALKAFTDETGATVYLMRPPRAEQRSDQRSPLAAGFDTVEADGEAASPAEGEAQAPDAREDGEAGRRRRRRRRRGRGRGGEASAEGASDEGAEGDGVEADADVEVSADNASASDEAVEADGDVASDDATEH
ncbi:MAG TPA: glutathione S-transferase N-terminal domain-containing protein [Hyphomonadaceae bacterium]|nr:glutathione S-transferase N-terminal domain-containing protein [Hyphomonadaceae bacterium]